MFKIKCLQFKLLSISFVLLGLGGLFFVNQAKAADSSIIEGWNYNGTSGSFSGLFYGSNGQFLYDSLGYPGKWGTSQDYYYSEYNYNNDTKNSLTASPNTSLNSGFSVCFWARDTTSSYGDQNIFLYDSSGNEKLSYNVRAYNGGHLYIGGNGYTITSGSFPSTATSGGNWQHYCVVADGEVGKIYYNGTLTTTVSVDGYVDYNNISSFNIKRNNGEVDLDDLIIFNRPLTSDEVNTVKSSQLTSSFGFSYCGDGTCNGTENATSCPTDCFSPYGVILPTTNPDQDPLIPDTNVFFYYTYNTSIITTQPSGTGSYAYIKIDRCLDASCSTTTPEVFSDINGTSTTSFILSGSTAYASSTDTPGQSKFSIVNPIDRLGNLTTTEETYKITPYYQNSLFGPILPGPAVEQVVDWLAYVPNSTPCVDHPLDSSSLCTGIDTSGLMGQIQCGAKFGITESAYFLFNPSCSSLNYIENGFGMLKKGFPFNAYFDLTDSINTAITTSQTATTTAIGIPFININSTSTNKFVILPLISSSSVSNAIGSDNKNLFRTSLGYLIWILTAAIVFFIITKI